MIILGDSFFFFMDVKCRLLLREVILIIVVWFNNRRISDVGDSIEASLESSHVNIFFG